MPCINGIDTCRAIRKHARFRSIPIVFLSGHGESASIEHAKELGAVRFLRKPIGPVELLRHIRNALNQMENVTPGQKRYSVAEVDTHLDDEELDGTSTTADEEVEKEEVPEPAKRLAPAIAPKKPPTEPYGGSRPARIMIIDDDTDIITFMSAVLRSYFEVFGVSDPVSAIYKIIRYQPDLLILDIAMPRLSGYQLSQLLRLNRNLRAIKILFASSKDSPSEIAYAKKLGAAGYLTKPFGGEDLLRQVTEIVDAPDFIIREKALRFEEILEAEKTEAPTSELD
jgi:DNA-binding response OmpR family regulator